MCAITFLKACTLSHISRARVTFYIQNCFYSELLEKKKISRLPNLKKLFLEIFKYHIEKKIRVDYFRSKNAKKMFRRKKNVDCKSPMKWPLCKWLWVIKTKEDERKKKKKGVLEGCLLLSFLLFCLFSHGCLFKVVILVQIYSCFLYFKDSRGFKFLKFWIVLFFKRWMEFELVVVRIRVQVWQNELKYFT